MALPLLAQVNDLADWLGESISEESDRKRAAAVLSLASAMVRNYAGRTWLHDSGILQDPLPDGVQQITLAVAGRAYTNPDGEYSERIDDYQNMRKVEESGMYLTRSERDFLDSLNSSTHGGLSVVSTTRGEFGTEDWPVWQVNGRDRAPDTEWR